MSKGEPPTVEDNKSSITFDLSNPVSAEAIVKGAICTADKTMQTTITMVRRIRVFKTQAPPYPEQLS